MSADIKTVLTDEQAWAIAVDIFGTNAARMRTDDDYVEISNPAAAGEFARAVLEAVPAATAMAQAIKSVRASERAIGRVVIGGDQRDVGLPFMVQQLGFAIDNLEQVALQSQQSPVQASDAVNDAARRYEIVRKLNVRQFSQLYNRNISGQGDFDDLVDQLGAEMEL